MKALLLAPTPPPAGGIAGWTVRMLESNLDNGWELDLVDEKPIGNRQVFGKDGKRHFYAEVKRCFIIWRELKRKLGDKNIRIVHSCIPSSTGAMMREYICALITKHLNRKFIIHYRCTVPNASKGRINNFILKRLCDISDSIISLNEQSSLYLRTITETPIELIPNFISHSELMEDRTINEKIDTVLYVGGLIKEKGIYDCIEVARKFPNISFRFIGKGNDDFYHLVKEYNIQNVFFCGQLDRSSVKEELKKADVFLFLSYFRNEGFSNALCEAMAAGLPCIVTDWAANKDMIEDKGGVVVNVRDVEGAIDALTHMRLRSVRKNMSDFNIQKVKTTYIDRVVLSEYINLYEKLLIN